MIEKLVKKSLKDFVQYKANPAEADIILDANEIPFDISNAVRQKAEALLRSDTGFNRYPDPLSCELRTALAKEYACSPDNIIAGSGSDQMISVIVNAFIDPGDRVMAPAPSFDMYGISSVIANAKVVEYDLDPENGYRYDAAKMTAMIKEHSPKIVFICSPNNPTGNVMPDEDIIKIIEAARDSIVVIDEAYIEFAGSTFTKKVLGYENAAVLRTFSKAYGIAGLRCGFSVSCKELAEQLLKTLPPYNLNRFTQFIAKEVFEDSVENERRIRFIAGERDRIYANIKDIQGMKVYPSAANFLLIKVLNGTDLYEEMLRKGIRIRRFTGKRLLEDCCRISVGCREDNDKVIKSIFDVFNNVF
jgi:histidinol-phosphate aminotransferase